MNSLKYIFDDAADSEYIKKYVIVFIRYWEDFGLKVLQDYAWSLKYTFRSHKLRLEW